MKENKIKISALVLYNSHGVNPWLSQVKAALARASQLVLVDLGPEPVSDFAQVRNQALSLATEEYAIFVDADEILTDESWPLIQKIVTDAKLDLVMVKRSDVFHGQELRFGEAGNQRLIRIGKVRALKYERPVHERVVVTPELKVGDSEIKLLHYSHPNLAEFLNKINFYATLEAKFRREKSQMCLLAALIFFPPAKFVVNFLIRSGWRDGMRGFCYAVMMSLHSLLVRVHGLELLTKKNNS